MIKLNGHLPVILVDFSVHCHLLSYFIAKNEPELYERDQNLYYDFCRALWAIRLTQPADMFALEDAVIVPVLDFKCNDEYWRHAFLRSVLGTSIQDKEKAYKGQRPVATPEFELLKKAGYDYISSPNSSYRWFGKDFFEADDMMAEARRLKNEAKIASPNSPLAQRMFYLSTLDTDLLQLVQEDIIFAWTGKWKGHIRLKDVNETLEYILKKHKYKIYHPSQFAQVKNLVGDGADNLPPGVGVGLFDLINDPGDYVPEFSLKDWSRREEFAEVLNQSESNIRWDHREQCIKFIERNCLGLNTSFQLDHSLT